MSFVNYLFSWNGRIGRLQWWLGGLVQAVILVVAGVLFTAGTGGKSVVLLALGTVLIFLTLWFGVGLTVKRLHDHNKSGFWFFVYFIPLAGFIWQVIECGLLRGSEGDNDFGPDPRFRLNVSDDIERLAAQRDRKASRRPATAVSQMPVAAPARLAPAVAARPTFGKRS